MEKRKVKYFCTQIILRYCSVFLSQFLPSPRVPPPIRRYFWVAMKQGTVTMPVFQSLEAFWPGVLSLVGESDKGLKSLHNYHQGRKDRLGEGREDSP